MNKGTDGRIINTPLKERFMAYVEIIQPQPDGCWNWMASTRSGYGQLKVNGKMVRCHCLSYEMFIGPIPKGMCVLHRCVGNRRCVNPDHLYPGTKKNNAEDRKNQGRNGNLKGEANGRARATDEMVKEIRSLRKPYSQDPNDWTFPMLVEKYHLSHSSIVGIVNGTSWKHIPLDSSTNIQQQLL